MDVIILYKINKSQRLQGKMSKDDYRVRKGSEKQELKMFKKKLRTCL